MGITNELQNFAEKLLKPTANLWTSLSNDSIKLANEFESKEEVHDYIKVKTSSIYHALSASSSLQVDSGYTPEEQEQLKTWYGKIKYLLDKTYQMLKASPFYIAMFALGVSVFALIVIMATGERFSSFMKNTSEAFSETWDALKSAYYAIVKGALELNLEGLKKSLSEIYKKYITTMQRLYTLLERDGLKKIIRYSAICFFLSVLAYVGYTYELGGKA